MMVRTCFRAGLASVVAVAGLSQVACATQPADETPAAVAAKQAVLARNAEMQESLSDESKFRACDGWHAADALFLPPNSPIRPYKPDPTMNCGGGHVLFASEQMLASAAGDLVVDVGWVKLRLKSDKPMEGKYTAVWRKEPDGKWMVVRDMVIANK